jgi:hypothetical protein
MSTNNEAPSPLGSVLDAWKRLVSERDRDQDTAREALTSEHSTILATVGDLPIAQDVRDRLANEMDLEYRRRRRDLEDTFSQPEQKPPSAEEEALARRRNPTARTSRRYKSLERFEYWLIPEVNPWVWGPLPAGIKFDLFESAAAAHAHLEEAYGNAHRAGDSTALLAYARADAWCFRSTWFVEQLEIWRDAGDEAKLRQVMKAFARNASKTSNAALHAEIVRDQAIFRSVVTRPQGQSLKARFGVLANERELSEETIRRIYEAYKRYYKRQTAAGVSCEEFFSRLATMADRIAAVQAR